MSLSPLDETPNLVSETVLTVPVTEKEWELFPLRVAGALLNMGAKPGEAFSVRKTDSAKLATIAEHRAADRRSVAEALRRAGTELGYAVGELRQAGHPATARAIERIGERLTQRRHRIEDGHVG